ncbi:hypothetical protein [Falsiroseomonas sp. E2-1-a20]|uniref:hypothetical protein n=1 Tax=Falsiroseomonas sp. E2-1-a20 TaxID=3239300 RepID=UPI003F3A84D0
MISTILLPEKISLSKIYAGIHYSQRSEHKAELYISVLAAGLNRYVGPFPVHIHYHFAMTGKPLDITNHAYMVKLLEDGMVHAGVIPGDEQKFVGSVTISARRGIRTWWPSGFSPLRA